MNDKKLSYVVLSVLIVIAGVVGFLVGKSFSSVKYINTAGSAAGTTFNTAKVAQINFSPATGTATTTSILNSDDSDRYVESAFSYCNTVGTSQTAYTGTGLASLTLKAATTSTANPAAVTNTNLAMAVTIATSSVYSANATSTYGTAVYQVWAAGSYMTFFTNATNTAACTVGVSYRAS